MTSDRAVHAPSLLGGGFERGMLHGAGTWEPPVAVSAQTVQPAVSPAMMSRRIVPAAGRPQMNTGEGADRTATELTFYRADHVLVGESGFRANFPHDARERVD